MEIQELRDKANKRLTVKKWYASKTLWANLIAVTAVVLQEVFGIKALSAEAQIALLGLLNIILRIVTKESIEW